ncbi:hypothetical protein BCR42DRAFT_413403 [Absidia repens]|uniref:Uncharacterized protein n=1 Tax=Absidia repens TaxID=90262 RepID=A0A1X2IHL5_9FUNG|nr:hypothetical protein BCR42DRAFT_413403 [Absidia repens]
MSYDSFWSVLVERNADMREQHRAYEGAYVCLVGYSSLTQSGYDYSFSFLKGNRRNRQDYACNLIMTGNLILYTVGLLGSRTR